MPTTSIRSSFRRDAVVALSASAITVAVLVPIGWGALHEHRARADDAQRLALQAAAEVLGNFGGGPEPSDAEALRVSTDAVAPEIPQGAFVLIDKKASSYAVGDIVVFHVGENNYLGRVVAVEQQAGRMTVGRNGETDRQVLLSTVMGRGVLNTR